MTHHQANELLPCLHCHSTDLSVEAYSVQPDNFHSAYVECQNCDARGPNAITVDGWLPSKEEAIREAIAAWNRRAAPASEPAVDRAYTLRAVIVECMTDPIVPLTEPMILDMAAARGWKPGDKPGFAEIARAFWAEGAVSERCQRARSVAPEPSAPAMLKPLRADERGEGAQAALICTCPSGDGSLRWPCPQHPPELDEVVEANRALLHQRSQLGIKKYGGTLGKMNHPHRDLLEHALLESLDLANYLQGAMQGLDHASAASVAPPAAVGLLVEEAKKMEGAGEHQWPALDPACACRACNPQMIGQMMFLCSLCGNKRCPHATDHRHACTNSNEPGQKGSAYE